MESMNDICKILFKEPNCIPYADILAFLAKRVPVDIAEQLDCDGHPDLYLSESVNVTDLILPLSSFAFPTDKIGDLNSILEYIVIIYKNRNIKDPKIDDPYKIIYASSLYLYCNLFGPNTLETQVYFDALGLLVRNCVQLDFETRLQVIRFLGCLVPRMQSELDKMALPKSNNHDDYVPVDLAPMSSILIIISLILSSMLNDLSLAAENSMKSERIRLAWREVEVANNSTYELILFLRKLISDMYGLSGTVRQSADRFIKALESEK
jgi:hypothetical protein